MTRETAAEIRSLINQEGGEISKQGDITGCTVWTIMIQDILEKGASIFFDDLKGKMVLSDWPEDMDEESKRVMKFTAFNGGEMELRAVKGDGYGNHDHIETWKDGKCLGYMHIHKDGDVENYGDC